MSVIMSEPSRRYSVLLTPADSAAGTWHTITATSIGDALRGVREGRLWENTQIAYPRDQVTVSAIECLGFAAH